MVAGRCEGSVSATPPQPVGEMHRRYTRRINFRKNWRGYLWQGRFSSFVMSLSVGAEVLSNVVDGYS